LIFLATVGKEAKGMIKIITDTTSSLTLQQAAEAGIPYLPQIIIFGEESYRDDTELTTESFLEKLKTYPMLPKTAAPQPALYTPIFRQLLDEGHTIIVLTPSAEVSGTFRNAEVASLEFPGEPIHVIDTRSVASGLGHMALIANRWAQEGKSAEEIIAGVRDLTRRDRLYALVDTLEYLYKGGRIGGAKMLFGSLLQVKPILTFKDGRIEPADSQRTKRKALARLKELVLADCPRSPEARLTICQGGALEDAQTLASELQELLGVPEIPIANLPAAILTHAGPGALAVTYFTE
jgi:DegV family protein with EDD domain